MATGASCNVGKFTSGIHSGTTWTLRFTTTMPPSIDQLDLALLIGPARVFLAAGTMTITREHFAGLERARDAARARAHEPLRRQNDFPRAHPGARARRARVARRAGRERDRPRSAVGRSVSTIRRCRCTTGSMPRIFSSSKISICVPPRRAFYELIALR